MSSANLNNDLKSSRMDRLTAQPDVCLSERFSIWTSSWTIEQHTRQSEGNLRAT